MGNFINRKRPVQKQYSIQRAIFTI